MTNAEKYKSAEERAKAHEEYCDKHNCKDCPCDFTQEDEDNGSTEWRLCAFRWLELEAEDKIEPCRDCMTVYGRPRWISAQNATANRATDAASTSGSQLLRGLRVKAR